MANNRREGLSPLACLCMAAAVVAAFLLSVCAGSVAVPVGETLRAIANMIFGGQATNPIITSVRLPRVLCVALTGAALSLAGCAMQGLLRNPLADGSTLGVSSGASLGAVCAIAMGLSARATMGAAMLCAFVSLFLILTLAYRLDCALSTNTIILIGVIFSMFTSAVISLVVTFAGDRVRSIMFWTMGSLAGASYGDALTLLIALIACGAPILRYARELNAFAIGEENARGIGVNVRRVKMIVLIAVSALIGVCVSIGGTIGFVGLVIPHMTRMVAGPNHKRLLPATLFSGAFFLMLADLLSRVALNPLELPIGVVTSLVGSVTFVYIFYRARRSA